MTAPIRRLLIEQTIIALGHAVESCRTQRAFDAALRRVLAQMIRKVEQEQKG